MARKQRTQPHKARKDEIARLARREKVWGMYVRGMWQAEIGRELGVDQKTISNDLKALQEEWVNRVVLGAVDQHKAEQLAKLDSIERACWEAWNRSCQPKSKTSAKSVKADSDREETSATEENQYGDPRFLAEIRHCVHERCEILGLHAPKNVKMSGDALNPIKLTVDGLDKARKDVEAWRRERFGIRLSGDPGANPGRN